MKRSRSPSRSPLLFPLPEILWNHIVKPYLSLEERTRLCFVSYNHQMLVNEHDAERKFFIEQLSAPDCADMAEHGSDDACMLYAKLKAGKDVKSSGEFIACVLTSRKSFDLANALHVHIPFRTDWERFFLLFRSALKLKFGALFELIMSGPTETHVLTLPGNTEKIFVHTLMAYPLLILNVVAYVNIFMGDEAKVRQHLQNALFQLAIRARQPLA
jgi:hypothetical protein